MAAEVQYQPQNLRYLDLTIAIELKYCPARGVINNIKAYDICLVLNNVCYQAIDMLPWPQLN